MKNKVLVESFYAGLGGHTTVFFSHSKFAEENNYKIIAGMYGVEKPLDSTIIKLNKLKIQSFFVQKKGKFDLFHALRHALQIRRHKPDLIFMHGGYGVFFIVLLCRILGKSKIVIRETQALTLKTFRQKINSYLSLLFVNKVIYLSEDYRNQYFERTRFLEKFKHKTAVIPNGLNISEYVPSTEEKENSIYKIGMCSRIVSIKDYDTLIEAIAVLKRESFGRVELLIAGDGSDLERLKQKVQVLDLSENVKFLGLLNSYELLDFYSKLDIYVHSSYGETMSNSIMQAQSCGLPIIATDVFGINNVIINGENGYLVKLGDVTELVNKIKLLVLNHVKRIELSNASRKYALNHLDENVLTHKYFQLFNNVLDR